MRRKDLQKRIDDACQGAIDKIFSGPAATVKDEIDQYLSAVDYVNEAVGVPVVVQLIPRGPTAFILIGYALSTKDETKDESGTVGCA